jgi:hypothetical protein
MVILGNGSMGSSLVLRGAKIGHFANGKPLRISVLDHIADRQREELLFRHAILAAPNEVCALSLWQLHADSLETRTLIEQFAREPNTILHVFVCLDSDTRAVEIGLRLWELMAEHPDAHMNIRVKSEASLAPILSAAGTRVQAFGMLEDTCTEAAFRGERIEAIARAIHEEFAAARRADPASQNDASLAGWDRLREDFRESSRQQADHMAIKMRAIGCSIARASHPGKAVTEFTPGEVELLAELEHRRWIAERLLGGWRHGGKTDNDRRIHSALVPWKDLPTGAQELVRETVRKIPRWLGMMPLELKAIRNAASG